MSDTSNQAQDQEGGPGGFAGVDILNQISKRGDIAFALGVVAILSVLYQRRKILTRKGFPFWAGCDSRLAKEIRHVSMHCSSGRLRQH